MATVSDLLARKGANVVTARADMSVFEAARLMNERRIGCVVVIDPGSGEIIGILSERDILTRVVAGEKDPRATSVWDMMTRDVVCAQPHTTLDELRGMMQSRRIRHVPIRDKRGLCGMVSIGDLNAWVTDGLSQQLHALEDYISRA